MGLSSKQVVGDGLDWGQNLMQAGTLELPKTLPMKRQHQQLQQQSEPLNCPRCGSTNTKFCYYNNYNKSQPRHFCKSCKRHWTKGGTLRNVPVGGGRKNKRPKTSNAAATSVAAKSGGTSTITTTATQMGIQNQNHQCQSNCNPPLLPLVDDQKSLSDILSQALNQPQFLLQHDPINSTTNFNCKDLGKNDGVFVGSTLPLSLPLQFPFSSSDNPSSNSGYFQSSNAYNYIGGSEAMEESTITTIPQPWQVAPTTTTSSVMDMPNYWADTWENFNTFLSTDLNIPWDDSEIKPSI